MSRIKRHALAAGMAAALLSGAGIATAGTASAATPSEERVVAADGWHTAGSYSTIDKCRAAGRASGQQWRCTKLTPPEDSPLPVLYILELKY